MYWRMNSNIPLPPSPSTAVGLNDVRMVQQGQPAKGRLCLFVYYLRIHEPNYTIIIQKTFCLSYWFLLF